MPPNVYMCMYKNVYVLIPQMFVCVYHKYVYIPRMYVYAPNVCVCLKCFANVFDNFPLLNDWVLVVTNSSTLFVANCCISKLI